MLESLELLDNHLLKNVKTSNYHVQFRELHFGSRLTGLIGPAGAGKTTMMLQYIKQHFPADRSVFYFSADHSHFKNTTLYEFIETLYLKASVTTFFIDDLHEYDNWSQELKNLYDGFPNMRIVFAGNTSLNLITCPYDLSRRAVAHYIPRLLLEQTKT